MQAVLNADIIPENLLLAILPESYLAAYFAD